MGSRSTSEFDCPKRLQPGDIVEVYVKQRYLQFTVLTVVDLNELDQAVTASSAGLGSVRFTWSGGHHRVGGGHGMRFYYVSRPKTDRPKDDRKWLSMDDPHTPRDGTEVLLRVENRAGVPGRLVAHYMRGGHCIDDHPPIAGGWYYWNGHTFDMTSQPTGWLPIPDVR